MTARLANLRRQIAVLLAILGPGFITAMVDNDAGGIFTYSEAGARFGYATLWSLIPITVALIVACHSAPPEPDPLPLSTRWQPREQPRRRKTGRLRPLFTARPRTADA